jgi:Ca2+-binding RTX toxin-like protein
MSSHPARPARRRRPSRRVAVPVVALAATFAVPAAADAQVSLTRTSSTHFQLSHSAAASTTMRQTSPTEVEITSSDDITFVSGSVLCPDRTARRIVCNLSYPDETRVSFSGSPDADSFFLGMTEAIDAVELRGHGGDDVLSTGILFGPTSPSGATFDGGEGKDVLLGGPGDDTFVPSAGGDTYNPGGGGDDRISFAGRAQAVSVSLDGVANDGAPGENANVMAGFDHVTLTDFGDAFTASTANAHRGTSLTVVGRGGADTITTRDGDDTVTTTGAQGDRVDTGEGHDTVTTGDGSDQITTAGGNDTVSAGAGGDTIDLGAGNDTATTTGGGGDVVHGGDGDDAITTADGADAITGGWGHDAIASGGAADVVDAGEDDDVVDGGSGADAIDGGRGDDALSGGDGADVLRAGPGDDSLVGGPGADLLDGGEGTADVASYADKAQGVSVTLDGIDNDGVPGENDQVVGVEDLVGSPHGDVLVGDDERNVIHGGWGDDHVDGRGGIDRLRGGRGDDHVIARDGDAIADDVGCNDGDADRATVDWVDRVAADCELLDRAPAPAVAGGDGSGAGGSGGGTGVGGTGGGGTGGGGAGGGGGAKPRAVKLADLVRTPATKRCRTTRSLRIRVPGASQLRRLEVTVRGKRVATLKSAKALRAGTTLRKLPRRGAYRVRLVGTVKATGKRIGLTVRYRGCA